MNYFQNILREACDNSEKRCPFWPDAQIESDLLHLDEEDKGDRLERYRNQCHEPVFFAKTSKNGMEFHIYCRRINLSLGNYYGTECNYSNEILAKELGEQFFR